MNNSDIKKILDGFDEVWRRVTESKKAVMSALPKADYGKRPCAPPRRCQNSGCMQNRRGRRR